MSQSTDPYRNYSFKLDAQLKEEAHFTACSGLNVRVTPIKYREAGDHVVRHIPGPVEYASVTLSYGLTSSKELWEWMLGSIEGRVERKNVSILMLSTDTHSEVTRWNLENAWPSEWNGAPLDAMSKEIAIESLTLVFDKLSRD